MSRLSVPYRSYELPWTASEEERRRLRRLLLICFGCTLLLCVLLPLLPVPPRPVQQALTMPPRFAKLVLERKPSAPAPPQVQPKPEQKPQAQADPRPQPQPKAQRPAPDARARAAQAGVLAFQDQLAGLRDNAVLEKAAQARQLSGAVGQTTHAERALITSKVGTGSGGINTATLSRGYGAGAGSLAEHKTSQVSSALGGGTSGGDRAEPGRASGKSSRSEEEIALVFDRNKAAIYALYTRALRDKPDLQGKVVLELTIAPDGRISHCELVSSELNDPELERKLIARIKLFRFEPRNVAPITVSKPIDFFPA